MNFFVLDDQSERCEGLKTLLRQIDRHANFMQAHSFGQVMHVLRFGLPDLLVIDWQLHWMDAASLVALLQEYPMLQVAVVLDMSACAVINPLLRAGVLGVIPRYLDPRLILRVFELVLSGGHYVPVDFALSEDEAATKKRDSYADKKLSRRLNSGMERLSPRQHQIMRLVHMGSTNKMIARALGISEGTVKIHLASVFRLLGATNRASAVALYNNWQFEKLRIWCSRPEAIEPNPIPGMRSPVPLRAHKNLLFGESANSSLMMAAQTTATYHVLDHSAAPTELPAEGTE